MFLPIKHVLKITDLFGKDTSDSLYNQQKQGRNIQWVTKHSSLVFCND